MKYDGRALREALEPIAALSFHAEPFVTAYARVGLDDFDNRYVWARSSVLGEAEPGVVVAALGVWEPEFVRRSLALGRARCPLRAVRDAATAGAAETVAALGAPTDAVRRVVTALRRGIDAADGAARVLFAGWRDQSWPDDPGASLWQAASTWREMRGDANLASCVVRGLDGVEANILNELRAGYSIGDYTATRFWSRDEVQAGADRLRVRGLLDDGELSDQGRRLREEIEIATDTGVSRAVAAVGDDLDLVVEHAQEWSDHVVDLGWFPDDQAKRQAG